MDILVEFDQAPSLLEFIRMEDDLTEKSGIKIDLQQVLMDFNHRGTENEKPKRLQVIILKSLCVSIVSP